MYRECVRNIWNLYFLNQLPLENDFDLKDEFDEISNMLFSSIILNPIGCESYKKTILTKPNFKILKFFTVVPSCESGLPIHINRENGKNKQSYWDHPVNFIKPEDVEMKFIDFFDFDKYGFRDFEFYFVNIISSSTNKDLIGRNALIKCNYAKILFNEKGDFRDDHK